MRAPRHTTVAPSAARLTESLRDIGYNFPSAVADLVDNSVTAGATRVEVEVEYAGADSRVIIADDGRGMSANGLNEALRFGSRHAYAKGDLGRYGLGLKTASLSQARSVTVLSRRALPIAVAVRQLSLDTVAKYDDWVILQPMPRPAYEKAREMLGVGTGTVVVWEKLDRIFQEQKPEGGWARRRVEKLAEGAREHLALVFHRFLEGEVVRKVDIVVNGQRLRPWNPFAKEEPATKRLPRLRYELTAGEVTGTVTLDRYVLPSRNAFTSQAEFERLSGPRKWNRQQGLYIYRANRLVQWGGWAGLRGIDEHLKLARVALDFGTDLDDAFNINVAKMRVAIPTQLRPMLERPIHEVCLRADDAYRRGAGSGVSDKARGKVPSGSDGALTLLALRTAAMTVGESEGLRRVLAELPKLSPEIATLLGLPLAPAETTKASVA